MPFAETHVMEERKRFIEEAHRSRRSFAAVCHRYGISRRTGYKWMDRWRRAGRWGRAWEADPSFRHPIAFVDSEWDLAERRLVAHHLRPAKRADSSLGFSWCRFHCGVDDACGSRASLRSPSSPS